ncbi:MAG: hypothetical protein EBS48_04855, partial [Actinobacteria bacterium]|nr:hypothetical protein [Actinomycetota bacterium]
DFGQIAGRIEGAVARAITDDPVAVVHLPVRVPNGFHGNWIPSAG